MTYRNPTLLVFLVGVLAVVVTACDSAAQQQRPSQQQQQSRLQQHSAQPITCDRFEPSASLEGDQLLVSLDTDLPDSTHIMVSVSRSYWAANEEYPIDYLETDATVAEWRKPRSVSVDHTAWRRKLDERLRMLALAGQPKKVTKSDSDVTVSFTVPINQPDSRFGIRNSNLTGKRVEIKGIRVVRGELKVKYPFTNTAHQPRLAEYGGFESLQIGAKYRLSRETPLVPERHPSDPLHAIASIRRVPAGAVIKVVSVDRSDTTNPWYQVMATATGAMLGDGWINSAALIGQEIRVVRP
jgi:Tfp pilus assembly protein PilV